MRRLILFDIDGTLLSTNGAARRAFERAMREVYGETGPIATHSFDGKTDPQIARELLTLAGFSAADIDTRLDHLWDVYLRELENELAQPGHTTLLYPGVSTLLEALERQADCCLALLTGNLARGAALKLESAGIHRYFGFGAFGSDAEHRPALPAIAVQRAVTCTGRYFRGHDVVVIGDTPNDMTCGQALGVFSLGVATGRHSVEALAQAGAHAVFPDLAHTDAVLRLLVDGVPTGPVRKPFLE